MRDRAVGETREVAYKPPDYTEVSSSIRFGGTIFFFCFKVSSLRQPRRAMDGAVGEPPSMADATYYYY